MRNAVLMLFFCLILMNLACSRGDQANQNSPGAANSNSGGAAANDTLILAQTKLALIADSRTSGFDTDVSSTGGIVTLTGKVETEEARTAAAEVASKVQRSTV
jgi:osmotically-inducible protein OsmY